MIHIVFSEADAKVLQNAIDLDESLQGKIVLIKDDYALGPIDQVYNEEGLQARKDWWRTVIEGGDFEPKKAIEEKTDYEKVIDLMESLTSDESEVIWIWAAQNSHDVCGYYWILSYLKEFQSRVSILYMNNLPFINEKGNIFYPLSLSEIPAKEFLKAKKLARPITLSEFEVDPDEWSKLCSENKGIRILEGGKKLVQYDYDFYDSDLKKYIMPDWQKGNKIINNYVSKAKHQTSEAYLLWRLKVLIAMDLYEVQGKVANMKDFEIKYKSKPE